jgi:hypothetical protein
MDRREFVKFLALLAAGAAAKPEQIAAFERYYDINSPSFLTGLVAVDEVMLHGLATSSLVLKMDIMTPEPLNLAINAYGGIVRWVAAPDQKIVCRASDFTWDIYRGEPKSLDDPKSEDQTHHIESDEWLLARFTGHVSYIDQTGRRRNRPLTTLSGSLGVA